LSIIEKLEKLISIESITGNEENILDYIEQDLKTNQFDGTVIRNSGGIIAIPKISSKKVALVGHVDTVPIVKDQKINFDDDNLISGRGSVDMKGGVAVILELLINNPKNIVGVFYTAEEGPYENNGLGELIPVLIQECSVKFSIILEPTNNEIQLGCLGVLNASLTIDGKAGHSARPWVGDNPIYKLSKIIEIVKDNEIQELEIDGLNFKQVMSITKVSSGVANNVIPDSLNLNLNFRYSPELNRVSASKIIENLFSKYANIIVTNCSDGAMPNLNSEEIKIFVDVVNKLTTPKQAWTDIARFYEMNIPSVNFGPGDPLLAHSADEHISKRQLLESYELVDKYLKSFDE